MSVLKKYFNKKSYASPVMDDYDMVVRHDEDGNEFFSLEKVDYPSLAASRGSVAMWSLNNLLKAGISPDFSIHTGYNTRLEGIGTLNDAVATLDAIIAEENNVNNEEKK